MVLHWGVRAWVLFWSEVDDSFLLAVCQGLTLRLLQRFNRFPTILVCVSGAFVLHDLVFLPSSRGASLPQEPITFEHQYPQ